MPLSTSEERILRHALAHVVSVRPHTIPDVDYQQAVETSVAWPKS